MKRNETIQIRIDPALKTGLQRLRDEHHVNISAWIRDLISAELDREFPPPPTNRSDKPQALPGSKNNPIPGWRPHLIDSHDWGSIFKGEASALPDELVGLWIRVTDRNEETFLTKVTKVTDRTDHFVIVCDSGKPDHA